jgi:TatA/E family protein of Tat protein translocase
VFNVGPEKLLLLFVIALLVLGPTKLPDAARQLGRALGEFRRVSGRLQDEVRDALADPKDALSAAVSEFRSEFGDAGAFGFGGLAMSAPVGEQASTASPSPTPAPPPPTPAIPPLPPSPDDPSLN